MSGMSVVGNSRGCRFESCSDPTLVLWFCRSTWILVAKCSKFLFCFTPVYSISRAGKTRFGILRSVRIESCHFQRSSTRIRPRKKRKLPCVSPVLTLNFRCPPTLAKTISRRLVFRFEIYVCYIIESHSSHEYVFFWHSNWILAESKTKYHRE